MFGIANEMIFQLYNLGYVVGIGMHRHPDAVLQRIERRLGSLLNLGLVRSAYNLYAALARHLTDAFEQYPPMGGLVYLAGRIDARRNV